MRENFIVQREHDHKEVIAGRGGKPSVKRVKSYQQAALTIGKDEAIDKAVKMTAESGHAHRVVSVLSWEAQDGEVIASATPRRNKAGKAPKPTPRRATERYTRDEPTFLVRLGRFLGLRKH